MIRTLEKGTVLSLRIMSLAMKLSYWDFRAVRLLRAV